MDSGAPVSQGALTLTEPTKKKTSLKAAAARRRAKSTPPPARDEPAKKSDVLTLDDLLSDPKNPRRRTERGESVLAHSLRQYGPARSVVIDRDGVVRAGNGTLEAAKAAGVKRVVVVDGDEETLVAVRRSDWNESQAIGYSVMDNQSAALAEWDYPELEAHLTALELPAEDFGFLDTEVASISANVNWEPDKDPTEGRDSQNEEEETSMFPDRWQVSVLDEEKKDAIKAALSDLMVEFGTAIMVEEMAKGRGS